MSPGTLGTVLIGRGGVRRTTTLATAAPDGWQPSVLISRKLEQKTHCLDVGR